MSGIVLCPVDLAHEQSGALALPEAVAQAQMRGAALHLLAVVPDLGSMLVATALPENFERDAAAGALAGLKALAAQHVPEGVVTETHVAVGHPAEQILGLADKLDAGLIVLASHAPDALRSLLVGSVADRIVHSAKQSVLVVRR